MYDYYSDDIYDIDDFLEHHGVKGMKWGVRRGRKSSGGSRRKGSSKSISARAKRAVNKGKAWMSKHKDALALTAAIGVTVGVGAASVGAAYAISNRKTKRLKNDISQLKNINNLLDKEAELIKQKKRDNQKIRGLESDVRDTLWEAGIYAPPPISKTTNNGISRSNGIDLGAQKKRSNIKMTKRYPIKY